MAEFSRPKRAKKKRNAQSAGSGDKQKINEFRDKNKITIQMIMPGTGLSKYSPVFSFEELNHPPYGFRETTMEVIKSLDYQSPMPVQSEVFPLFLQGHHMLVSAPTGSGKTAAYLLPVLHAISTEEEATVTAINGTSRKHLVAPRCVVLSTTQELAGQVWMEAVRLGRNLFPQHGKIVILKRKHYNLCKKENPSTVKPSKNIRDQRLPRNTKLLITTPKRLATLITRTGSKCPIDFSRWVIEKAVRWAQRKSTSPINEPTRNPSSLRLICCGTHNGHRRNRRPNCQGLTMVVNYDLPPSATEYIHRVGRTGRAGLPGHAITLWTDADLPHLSAVLEVMKRSGAPVDEELQRLVSVWCSRRAARTRTRVTGGVLSQRRGERRLAARVVRGSGKQRIKQKQLLRPWNPPRAKISEVPGALARNIKMVSQTKNSN
nr:unnamed protein product [Spirometra erinaceieuropaei]